MIEANRSALHGYMEANWTETETEFENVNLSAKQTSSFVQFFIRVGDTDRVSLGSNRFREAGVIVISIFTPNNVGTRQAGEYADTLIPLWREKNIGTVRTYTPTYQNIGNTGSWFQGNIVIPFDSDEVV